jgi:hypothetical protein
MTTLELNNETAKQLRKDLKQLTGLKVGVRKVNTGYIVQAPFGKHVEGEGLNKMVSYLDTNNFRNVCDLKLKCSEYQANFEVSFSSSFTVRQLAV